jgi:hypothetical protein
MQSYDKRPNNDGRRRISHFTLEDQRKILTGVAPSGSSKTGARREKQAADKRRKLSQAAMNAVREADVDNVRSLEREALLILGRGTNWPSKWRLPRVMMRRGHCLLPPQIATASRSSHRNLYR